MTSDGENREACSPLPVASAQGDDGTHGVTPLTRVVNLV